MMNPRQLETLATLVALLRNDWDVRGIAAALAKVDPKRTAYETAVAAIRAAEDPTNRTPATIAFTGPHWGEKTRSRAPQHWQPPHPCKACNNVHNEGTPCGRRDPAVAAQGAARARAVMRGELDPDELEGA